MPAYNERNTIEEILSQIKAVGLASEIIIVDDGSTDGTRDILSELDGRDGIKVLLHEKNMGKGAAVRTALEAVTGDVVHTGCRP